MTDNVQRLPGSGGWVLDYEWLRELTGMVCEIEDVSMEQVEAVTLALIDMGYLTKDYLE